MKYCCALQSRCDSGSGADASPAEETGQPDQLQPPSEDSSEHRGAFRALRHRNYRLYFFGQLTSLAGLTEDNQVSAA